MRFLCPVCGYPEMEEPAERFAICPSCGTEFGNHDFVFDAQDYPAKLAELRSAWLAAGAPWFDDGMPRPANWDPFEQVMAVLGLVLSSSATNSYIKHGSPETMLAPRA
jgi:hypothetical protein